MRRSPLLLTASVALAGCGGGHSSPDDARACLEGERLHVLAGDRAPDDSDAPDTELIVDGRQSSAFLGFYDTEARAVRYEPALQRLATGPRTVERHASITIFWVRGRDTAEGELIRACVT